MINAYNFDSELKIYSKKDRIDCIKRIMEKLGVPENVEGVITLRSIRQILYVNTITRTLKRADPVKDMSTLFYKYLILPKKDGTVYLLYNSKIYTNSDKIEVEYEGMFAIQDVVEAVRFVECSIIDIELECDLKETYSTLL